MKHKETVYKLEDYRVQKLERKEAFHWLYNVQITKASCGHTLC